jgi:hypothetical protein
MNNEVVQLLPTGQFIINRKNGDSIKGRFSLYALDRFCDAKGIASYFIMIDKISQGMSLGDYADLILIALQDYHRSNPADLGMTRADIFDLIDNEFDGVMGGSFVELITHAVGRVTGIEKTTDAPIPETDKKKLKNGLTAKTSSRKATKQASA